MKPIFILRPQFVLSALTMIGLLGFSLQVSAQKKKEPVYMPEKKLNELHVWLAPGPAQNIENALYKGVGYTESEKTKKHPLPYAYVSQAYYLLHTSKDAELRERWEVDKLKALKNSLKYAEKFIKKDKDSTYVFQWQDHFDNLRVETIKAAETEMTNEKWSRAKGYYKSLTKLNDDPGAFLMFGTTYFANEATEEAEEAWSNGFRLLEEFGIDELRKSQKDLLKYAIVTSSEMLFVAGEIEQAMKFVALGDSYFSGDKEFEAVKRTLTE